MNWLTASIFRIYFSRCLTTKGELLRVLRETQMTLFVLLCWAAQCQCGPTFSVQCLEWDIYMCVFSSGRAAAQFLSYPAFSTLSCFKLIN